MNRLEIEDIELCITALRSLKSQASTDHMMTSLLTIMMAPTKEEADRGRQVLDKSHRAKQGQQDALKESITMLEAKLIAMKRNMMIV